MLTGSSLHQLRLFERDLLVWPLLAAFTILMSRYTNLDWQSEQFFYDASRHLFPARGEWVWAVLGHLGTKYAAIAAGVGLGIWLFRHWQRADPVLVTALTYTLATALVAVSVNGQFKSWSGHSCPWDVQGFGGTAHYFRLLATVPFDAGPGRCLPSGHAAVGFMWLSAIYAARRWFPQHAGRTALAVIAFGLLCGIIQIVRGAHFPSHVLFSAITCGSIAAASIRLPVWDRLHRYLVNARAVAPVHATTRAA